MPPVTPRRFRRYIDARCTWKHSRDISGKSKYSIFHVFRFPLISGERFHVQQSSTYPQKAIEKAGDIGWFDFQSVPFFMVKNVTCKVCYVPFSTFLALENGTDWKLNWPMSPAFPLAFQGYIDLRCTWKRFRDRSGKPPGLKKRKEEKKVETKENFWKRKEESGIHRKLLKNNAKNL